MRFEFGCSYSEHLVISNSNTDFLCQRIVQSCFFFAQPPSPRGQTLKLRVPAQCLLWKKGPGGNKRIEKWDKTVSGTHRQPEWRATASPSGACQLQAKALRHRAPPGMGEGGDWWAFPRVLHRGGCPGSKRVNGRTAAEGVPMRYRGQTSILRILLSLCPHFPPFSRGRTSETWIGRVRSEIWNRMLNVRSRDIRLLSIWFRENLGKSPKTGFPGVDPTASVCGSEEWQFVVRDSSCMRHLCVGGWVEEWSVNVLAVFCV